METNISHLIEKEAENLGIHRVGDEIGGELVEISVFVGYILGVRNLIFYVKNEETGCDDVVIPEGCLGQVREVIREQIHTHFRLKSLRSAANS